MQKVTLRVVGLHCQGCVKSLTKAFLNVNGVQQAEVSLEKGTADVVFDEGQVGVETLVDTIENAGFDGSVL